MRRTDLQSAWYPKFHARLPAGKARRPFPDLPLPQPRNSRGDGARPFLLRASAPRASHWHRPRLRPLRRGAVPDGKGSYRLLAGNEVGVLLLDFICQARQSNGTMPQRPVAVTTIVSTDMADPIAAHYGVELRRTSQASSSSANKSAFSNQKGIRSAFSSALKRATAISLAATCATRTV